MLKKSRRGRWVRAMLAVAVGGSAFQTTSCSSDVRNALVGGLEATTQGVASVLITAFFIRFIDDGSQPAF